MPLAPALLQRSGACELMSYPTAPAEELDTTVMPGLPLEESAGDKLETAYERVCACTFANSSNAMSTQNALGSINRDLQMDNLKIVMVIQSET
jgi:hypothetical protein